MKHRTTMGAARLFLTLLVVAACAPAATADDYGYPPAPAPVVPEVPALPVAPAVPAVPAEPDAPRADNVYVIDLAAEDGVKPGFTYEVRRAPVRDAVVLEDVTPMPEAPSGTFASTTLTRTSSCCGRCQPQDPCCPDPCCRRRGWDVTLEAGVTWFEDHTGIIGLTPPAGTNTFNWSESTLDPAIGGRATIGYRWNAKNRIEGRAGYSGEATGSSVQRARRFGFSATPAGAVTLSPAATATLSTETTLWNGELNWWRQLKCTNRWRFEGIAGLRYLQYREVTTATNWVGLAAGSFLSNTAKNRFIGAQLGGSAVWHTRRVEVGASVKGLIGHMQSDLRERDTDIVTGGATTDATRETSNFGYGFEGEVSLLFRLSRRIGLTAAYTILFLGDVARAGTTLDLSRAMTGSAQLTGSTDSTVIHSVFAGVRIDI